MSTLSTVYKKIKYIISGCRTLDDAIMMCQLFNLNKKEKDLITSVINSIRYDSQVMDIKTFFSNIKEINNCRYQEEAYDIINTLIKKTADPVQIRTFQRLAKTKQNRPQYVSLKEIRENNANHIITKQCPHCAHSCAGTRDTDYIVCGYTDHGYDWGGCGCDWCFKCEKILCKSWEADQLFLPINRIHTEKCCKKHAAKNNNNYSNDYCQCTSNYKSL